MSYCNEKGSYKGECCCNCKHHMQVMKHPWNKGEAKGSIKDLFGYICANPMDSERNSVIFFDRNHGMCEMHESVEPSKPL